jgi:hypothetical protein
MAKLARPKEFADTRQLPREPIMMEIGRLAIVSASIEDLLHMLYWRLAGLADPIGAVITGDARATRLSEDVLRIAKAAKIDQSVIDDLQDIFADLIKLTKERNQFVHWIWSWNTKTHEDRIDPPGYKPSLTGRYVTTEDVAKVADDLVWIEHRLSAHLMTEQELSASKAKYGMAGAPDAPTPWLGKRSPPDSKRPTPGAPKK